jgi:hypothetical protein
MPSNIKPKISSISISSFDADAGLDSIKLQEFKKS